MISKILNLKITLSKMGKIYYYYDPIVKEEGFHYSVDYYCTNGRKKVWAGKMVGETQIAALKCVKNVVNILNMPRPIFGQCSLLSKWIWWMNMLKNKNNFKG